MAQTPEYSLEYPVQGDPVDVAGDISKLAFSVEDALVGLDEKIESVEAISIIGDWDGTNPPLCTNPGDAWVSPDGILLVCDADGGQIQIDIKGPQGEKGSDGAPGANGKDGSDGAPGKDGSDGAPGAAGKDGSDGAPGAAGRDGSDGAPGLSAYEIAFDLDPGIGTEEEWLESLKGEVGSDGLPGRDGSDGLPGLDGRDGSDGLPGLDGRDGSDGSDGAPGLSAYEIAGGDQSWNSESEWLESLKGEQGDVGSTGEQGPQGEPGAGVVIKGTADWNDIRDLDSSDPNVVEVGDLWILNDPTGAPEFDEGVRRAAATGDGVIWGGAEWKNVGPIQGPQGPAGVDGSEGTAGRDGSDGADGAPGEDGKGWTGIEYDSSSGTVTFDSDYSELFLVTGDLRGADGAPGAPGAPGDTGSTGDAGADGKGWTSIEYDSSSGTVTFDSDYSELFLVTDDLRGAQGEKGDTGSTGDAGDAGEDGKGWTGGSYDESTGIVEFFSDDSLDFSTGDLRGADGAPGAPGETGSTGEAGKDASFPTNGNDGDFLVLDVSNPTWETVDIPDQSDINTYVNQYLTENNYVDQSGLTQNYYNKTEIDQSFYNKTEVDAELANKQDNLGVGNAGDVLTTDTDESGFSWQPVPTEIPDGGNIGDVLVIDQSGDVSWTAPSNTTNENYVVLDKLPDYGPTSPAVVYLTAVDESNPANHLYYKNGTEYQIVGSLV